MVAPKRAKASDILGVCKKLTTTLKKRYNAAPRQPDRPVLETILYAICLENASNDEADRTFAKLTTEFHDLNEIRVSSISELTAAFGHISDPELRALRVRNVLQFVFEKQFAFDFENLRRKTLDLAAKQLTRIKKLSPFIRLYTLQSALGSHLVPIDNSMCTAVIWLGLAEPQSKPEAVSETLKSALRKADAPQFCHLLRCLATDPLAKKTFRQKTSFPAADEIDINSAPERLRDLYDPKKSLSKKKSPVKKAARNAANPAIKKKSVAKNTKMEAPKAKAKKTKKKTKS